MASESSHYLADKQLNAAYRNVAFTPPTTVYVALNTSDPTRAGNDTEVTLGNGYARLALVMDAASLGASANSAILSWTAAGAAFGTITHISVWDASTVGNMLSSSPVDTPETVADLNIYEIAIGALTLAY